jgi:small nuclear ribonucleoprotein (snRNP)-like protein
MSAAATAAVGAEAPAIDAARELLGQRMLVEVPDGRKIEGEFQCLDPQGNLILGNAYEQLPGRQAVAAAGVAAAAAAADDGGSSAAAADAPTSSSGQAEEGQQQPQQPQPNRPGERALGMVLVPREQQKEVWVLAMPKQRAAIEQMVKEAEAAEATAAVADGRGGGGAGETAADRP